MAFCIFLVLDSQDRNVRLAAVVVLAVMEQIREWLLISSIKGLRGKAGNPPLPLSGAQARKKRNNKNSWGL